MSDKVPGLNAIDSTSSDAAPAGALQSLQKTKPQFSILGSKVGALSDDTSGDIKAKLQEMIAAREAEKTGFGALAEGLMPFAGSSDQWANNRRAVNETKQQRDQDIASMRLGIANLDAQQKQQALEAQDLAAQNARVAGTGGTSGTSNTLGGMRLPPQVVANLNAIRRLDPKKALEMENEVQKAMLNPDFATLQNVVVQKPDGTTETVQRSKGQTYLETMFGPQAAATEVAPSGPKPAATAVRGGAVEEAKAQGAGREEEEKAIGKHFGDMYTAHVADLDAAPNRRNMADAMLKDIDKADTLVGKLADPKIGNAILALVSEGVKAGTFGQAQIAGLKDFAIKMDPKAKESGRMDAYIRLAQNLTQLQLDYAQKAFHGQGSVTENERRLIENVIGNPDRMTPQLLKQKALVVKLEAMNRQEQERLRNEMEQAGQSWRQFLKSPERKELQANQYKRMAKALGVAAE